MSRTQMAFPNETLTAIFDQLPPSSLAAAARVSTRFNGVAERVLYASVYITDVLSEDTPVPIKTLWWCAAMRRRAHLVECARRVHVRWQSVNNGSGPSAGSSSGGGSSQLQPPPLPHYLVSACEQLADVLRMLTGLETLDLFLGPANLVRIRTPGPGPWPTPYPHHPIANDNEMHALERVIHGCRFSQLRSCTLGAESAKGSQPYTHTLLAFLASLPTLRHLRLSDLHAPLDNLPPTALPMLSSFRGSPDAAASLLPGRPVQYLSLVGQDSDVNRDNLPRMTCTTVPLRYLDLSAMSARPMLLRNVSTYLPTVESLRVKLALRHTLHYSFSGIRILAGLSSVLNAFHSLSYLDLSPTGVDGVGRADSLEELGLCMEWHRACPTLRRIVFPSQTEWTLDFNNVWAIAPAPMATGNIHS